nr:hypothetical protein RVX_2014 [Nitratidesulfovibrio sp. HK-II]
MSSVGEQPQGGRYRAIRHRHVCKHSRITRAHFAPVFSPLFSATV